MILPRVLSTLSVVFLLSACGGSKSEVKSPTSEGDNTASESGSLEAGLESAETTDGESSGPHEIPTECHQGDSPCTPSPRWVKKLCEDVYPGVALHLFHQKSPFTHGYLSRKTRAVNASGGATSGDEWLVFDEEVVLLYHRAADSGGIQVSGSGGGYDAMRLDGSCVTLGAEEVRMQKPPTPKYSKVPWRYIGKEMQKALRSLPSIKEAYIARRQECKGAFSGTVTKKCLKKDSALNQAIVSALTAGEVELPQPEERP